MRNIIALSFLVCLVSCNKQDIEVPELSPVFFISANIDGTGILMEAGRSSYYMHTDLLDGDTHLISRSTMSQMGMDDSRNGLIGLDLYYPSDQSLAEVLSMGDVAFRYEGTSIKINTITSDVEFNLPVESTLKINSVQHNLPVEGVEFHQSDSDTLQVNYLLDGNGLVSFSQILRTNINTSYGVFVFINDNEDGSYDISVASDTDEFNVRWSDGKLSTMRTVDNANLLMGRLTALGIEPVDIRVQLPQGNLSGGGKIGYRNDRQPSTPQSDINIDILYENEMGERFRSRYFEQPSSSAFNIESITPYNRNDKDQMTYKIKGNFQSSLLSSNGETINLKAQEFVLAVAGG